MFALGCWFYPGLSRLRRGGAQTLPRVPNTGRGVTGRPAVGLASRSRPTGAQRLNPTAKASQPTAPRSSRAEQPLIGIPTGFSSICPALISSPRRKERFWSARASEAWATRSALVLPRRRGPFSFQFGHALRRFSTGGSGRVYGKPTYPRSVVCSRHRAWKRRERWRHPSHLLERRIPVLAM